MKGRLESDIVESLKKFTSDLQDANFFIDKQQAQLCSQDRLLKHQGKLLDEALKEIEQLKNQLRIAEGMLLG